MWALVFTLMIDSTIDIKVVKNYDTYFECFQVQRMRTPQLHKGEHLNCAKIVPNRQGVK